jgi:peptidoglycan hydrolase CwlO-like protein
LHKKVEALEKSRSANTKSLASVEKSLGALDGVNRRIDETKTETKTEIDALSGRIAALQQETNAKLSELSAAQPARRRGARPVQNRAAPATEQRQRQAAPRNDAFDPSQHPGAPGAPRPLGVP